MTPIFYIDFIPPLVGLEAKFNTFRLGLTWSKRLKKGDRVYLADKKNSSIFATAKVMAVYTGTLTEMCERFGADNHTQIGKEPGAPDTLEVIRKIYGPHIAVPQKKTTVIYLRRLRAGSS